MATSPEQYKANSIGQGSSSISVTLDNTPTQDNLLVGVYVGGALYSGSATCTGFTSARTSWDWTAWFGHTVFLKKAGASESKTITVNLPNQDSGWWLVFEWDGDDFDLSGTITDIVDQYNENTGSSGTSLSGASITSTEDRILSVFGGSYWQSSVQNKQDNFTWSTGWDEYCEEASAGAGGSNEFQGACSLNEIEDPGTENPTMTWSDSSSGSFVFQITFAMEPAAVAVPQGNLLHVGT